MEFSAQNSSGVYWCRRRVRFNEVPEKAPTVPEKVWQALVQSQVTFNTVPENVLEKVWEALVPGQVRSNRFRRRFWKGSRKSWCKTSQVQQGSREDSEKSSGECSGRFGAEPGQIQ